MIDVVVKIFCALLCGFTFFYVYKQIMNLENTRFKEIIVIMLLSMTTYISYVIQYNTEITILKFILFIIIFKMFYRESMYKIIIANLLSIILVLICDVFSNIILISFLNVKQLRGLWYIVLMGNSMVCIFTILIIRNRRIKNKIRKIINQINNKDKVSYLIILTLSIIMAFYTIYNISLNYNWSEKYFINIIITISYIIITLIFFKDKIEYNLLEEKYDALFDYFSEIAESIDDLNLTTHEYKNQIAIVGNYIENKKYKKAKEYINDISNSINKDEGLLVNLTDIPTGGLKGLLYYKIIVSKNQKIEIVLDVGRNIKPMFKYLTDKESRIITRIIGVYIDNAVSEAKKNNRIVNIEIYNIDDQLYFAISNKIDKNININKIGKKGFTTKGKGHGKGLYLVNRIISRNKWLNSETKLVNDYYICKLKIDTKNIGK